VRARGHLFAGGFLVHGVDGIQEIVEQVIYRVSHEAGADSLYDLVRALDGDAAEPALVRDLGVEDLASIGDHRVPLFSATHLFPQARHISLTFWRSSAAIGDGRAIYLGPLCGHSRRSKFRQYSTNL